jgi:hypothetical protein
MSGLALAVGLCQPAVANAALPVSLGSAANYSVLEIGNGNVSLAAAPPNGFITGNVGAAGGNVSDGGSLPIMGNVFLGTGATSSGLAGNVSGSIFTNVDLSSAVTAATNASTLAAALATSGGGVGFATIDEGNNVTLNLAPGVYNLTDFKLQVGDVVNLAAGGSYVFNISGTLSLSSAEILTASGLSPLDVLFNITGTQGVGFSGGIGNESILDGIILAPNASIGLTPGAVTGEIISGDNINIASGGSVTGVTVVTPVPEPTTLLFGLGLTLSTLLRRRR